MANPMLSFSNYDFLDISFKDLMQKRIYRVLIICSNYDFFLLEEDGRIDEQIFNEYVSLNLRYPPVFVQADSAEKAFRILDDEPIDLVINMLSVSGVDPFELGNSIKARHSRVPIVVLTPFSREVRQKLQNEDLRSIDYVFSWLGDSSILLAIIKLIEDKMNLQQDVQFQGVQGVLLIEDSIRFYSSYLPNMYRIILQQSQAFMTEGLNEYRGMMRMRGRPKIILATNYEDAVRFFHLYRTNLLGVVSDIKYPRNGVKDKEAGFRFFRLVREYDNYLPFVFQSSDLQSRKRANECGAAFIHKDSKNLSFELKNYIFKNLAFGDFIFRDPKTGKEISRAANLQEVQRSIQDMPIEVLKYHFERHDFSRWLNARVLFPIARILRDVRVDDFESVSAAKAYILKAIAQFRVNLSRGVIAIFDRNKYDEYLLLARIGEGSLGGKARGLAFIDSFLNRHKINRKYDGIVITIPRTVVITTDFFDEFMEINELFEIALSDASDEEILKRFVGADLPQELKYDLRAFLNVTRRPLAIRSSSVLEDSHYQPFAGIYSTYMIPFMQDKMLMQQKLELAIKSVYASVYFQQSKSYMEATSNMIAEEKMSIILQEICGKHYEEFFYPNISGSARSINYYPIGPEKPEDGIARIALGLGKTIVEGEKSLRFSPKYPEKALQLSSAELTLRDTQKHFYALETDPEKFQPSTDDSINLNRLRIKSAEKHGSLRYIASTYDFTNNIIRDGYQYEGKKVITFAHLLKHKMLPIAEIIQELLQKGCKELNSPVEIEFAINIDRPKGYPVVFNFLQIRPTVDHLENEAIEINHVAEEEVILFSTSALGNGLIEGICDVVYVKPETFNAANTKEIAKLVDEKNKKLAATASNYVLVGPGRWGSSDPWLGIPVKWPQISSARIIVESGLADFRIDASQGTHFFQNLTSFRAAYFTVNPHENDGIFNIGFLNTCKAVEENQYLRHVRFDQALTIKVDGRKNRGVVYKPGHEEGRKQETLNFG